MFDSTTLYYVHPDHVDRPVVMTNASAMTIAWQAKYDPFGNQVAITVTPVNNQRLPGQWFQSEDGLAYNWHRTYDPTLGRYTQADPLGFVDGPGIYNYSGNNPLMALDPEGLQNMSQAVGRNIPGALRWVLPGAAGPVGMCLRILSEVLSSTQVAPGTCPCTVQNESNPPHPLPEGLIGTNPRPGNGKTKKTDAPAGSTPEGLFGELTGGQPPTALPDGTLIGPNGVRLRPGRKLPNGKEKNPGIDIPENGQKPPETLHWK